MGNQGNVAKLTEKHQRPASDVKSSWRDIVDEVNTHGEVVVTNHSRPQVVVVSIERFRKLQEAAAANDPMNGIREDWDRKLAWLQEPGAGEILRQAFNATPEELAASANKAALRRRNG